MCFKCSSYMFSNWFNLVGIYTRLWNILSWWLTVSCLVKTDLKSQYPFFKNQYVHDTLKKCGFVNCSILLCIFQYFLTINLLVVFHKYNNQGFIHQGSSLFLKTHMWKIFHPFALCPSTINCDSCLRICSGFYDPFFKQFQLPSILLQHQLMNSMFGVYSSKDEIKPRFQRYCDL